MQLMLQPKQQRQRQQEQEDQQLQASVLRGTQSIGNTTTSRTTTTTTASTVTATATVTASRVSALHTTFLTPPSKTQITQNQKQQQLQISTFDKSIQNIRRGGVVLKKPQAAPTALTSRHPWENSKTCQPESLVESIGNSKMEHSYTRDKTRPAIEINTGLAPARTILVRRPPQCPSCHTHPLEEHDLDDSNQAQIPSYNEIAAKESMNECARIAKYVKNTNPDDDDWESRINQIGWSSAQKNLFAKVTHILDNDQLGRLANAGRQNEAMQRRVIVDKSASRMRKTLAAISWDSRLTQWLHFLLMDSLPSTYMASYLDILQTLKSKLPLLMDKMLFSRPMNISQELLAPVMKKQWEPLMLNVKSRKLAQNTVIVALPSIPTSGPVPNRVQKLYHCLASITQIVHITLPTSSAHITRQPLDQVAEQIVSLTRVKIQELRSENSARSIILVGFNAGASLALQVAISENVACVVCIGFAYNTFNGVRGAPDDRILDIKIPILFVIGQNSARSSSEEIESLREKMQSETSLVIVGSADDVLRVARSRRKIENVTQTMVDSMVVDEIYEFIKRTLNHPPGPRIPTSITSAIYGKQIKNAISTPTGESKFTGTPTQRKRKNEALSSDADATPAKTKYVPHIGRPRTRPLPTPDSASKAKNSSSVTPKSAASNKQQGQVSAITNEDLNNAIQSILSDNIDGDASEMSTDLPQKIKTNFELVAQSKSTPMKTALINPLQKQGTSLSGSSTGIVGSSGTKIKMIPSSQFVQLKPSLQSQSKIYTIKTSAMQGATGSSIGSIVNTPTTTATTQQQIFTLKSPNGQTTQFVTAAPASAQQKYTVVKNASGGTTVQLTTPKTSGNTGVDLSNIIDMPIIFADNEGNLTDSVGGNANDGGNKSQLISNIKPSSSSGVGQLIISQKIIKEASTTVSPTKGGTYVIGKGGNSTTIIQSAQQPNPTQPNNNKPNKVVFINRNTMKPCPNIISRSNVAQQLPKYAKVVVTNPKTAATTLVSRAAGTNNTVANSSNPTSTGTSIVSTVKQVNLQALNSNNNTTISNSSSPSGTTLTPRNSGILNMATKSFQIINAGNVTTTSGNLAGVTATTGENKPVIRNILVKPGGLKQIPEHLKTQLLNRNLTVRKLVNIVPSTKTVGGATVTITPSSIGGVTVSSIQDAVVSNNSTLAGSASSASAIQSTPKIITLNPINPSTQPKND